MDDFQKGANTGGSTFARLGLEKFVRQRNGTDKAMVKKTLLIAILICSVALPLASTAALNEFIQTYTPSSPFSEPTMLLIVGAGLVMLAGLRRKIKRK